jgi:hypothetical protein
MHLSVGNISSGPLCTLAITAALFEFSWLCHTKAFSSVIRLYILFYNATPNFSRNPTIFRQHTAVPRHTVGQIPKKCKETSNLMWLSLIWFILVLFVCWNLFCTLANLRIKCVTETQNISLFFYKNLKSSFSTWFTGFFTFLVALAHGAPAQLPPYTSVAVPLLASAQTQQPL